MDKEKWIEEQLDRTIEIKLDNIFSDIEQIQYEWERNEYDSEYTFKRICGMLNIDADKWISETKSELEEDYNEIMGDKIMGTNKGINMALTNCEIAEVNDYLFSDEDFEATNVMMGSMIGMLEVKADVRIAQMKENGFDHLNLYLTDFTPALIAVINACWANKMFLTVYHYDKSNDMYVPQELFKSANVKNNLTFGV